LSIDFGQIQQLLSTVKFPVSKNTLIEAAKQHGTNDQITGLLQRLPDKTYNSPQDIQNELGGQGNIGGIKL
jgi:Protein of unknown function (DUF2795)